MIGLQPITYQDARRVGLVDGLETNILRVSPDKSGKSLFFFMIMFMNIIAWGPRVAG